MNFVQRHADADLRGHTGDRVAAGLGSERGRPRHAGVDFDEIILERLRVERELHVAAALDLERADDLERAVAQHVIFFVGQRLGRAHHHRVAGVDADRVEVFHVADGDGGVVLVADDLVFDLLKALDALFDQHLADRRERQRVFHQRQEFFLVVGEAAAGAAERERRAQHHRVADLFHNLEAFFNRACHFRREYRLAELFAQLLKKLPILRPFNGKRAGAEQLHAALLQDAFFVKLHGEIETRLPADARQDRVRALIADDLGDVFERQRLHIHLVRDGGVGHDGGGVGVAEDDLVPLLFERQARLRAGVVKFRRLPDDDRAGADDQHFFDVRSLWHNLFLLLGLH